MQIIIQKFGVTSVNSIESRNKIVNKVRMAINQGKCPVVVVSALGRKGQPYATDTLIDLLDHSASPRDLDLMMSCGEIISSVIMASCLRADGLDAVPLTGGQAGIITDNHFGNANIKRVETKGILNIIREGGIPVVAGFQGITEQGEVTTLGRGGSDVTASILGEALQASAIEIYTDVDGVMTADPRLVPNAKVLSFIDYNEVFQLAEYGAKVIHPRAVEISMRSNIPIFIKNSNNHSPGTMITSYNNIVTTRGGRDSVVTGIAHIPNRAQVHVKLNQDTELHSDSLFFTEIANRNISIDLINIFPEEKVFIIDSGDILKIEELLREKKYSFSITEHCCKVTAIGNGMRGVPGVMARIITALNREGIQVLQTADSHNTISCLVKDSDTIPAIKALHKEFNLGT